MLAINYENNSVTTMRPEAPTKMFSSADVPHGTNSVYVKAAMILNQNHGKSIGIPQFTTAEKSSMITARKSALTAVDTLTDSKLSVLEQTQVLNPTSEEIAVEFAKKDLRQPLYADEAAATAALVDARKTDLATAYVNERIAQFLDVPTLTDEWKAQFTTVQSE